MAVSVSPERLPTPDPAPQPLQLVAEELAVTFNDVRVALEQYAEGDQGPAPLERCAELLHTAGGVLQITETHGGALLAEEMEQACRHLLKTRRDGHADDGVEALMRAAVQLPAYVERIRNGGRDVPLVLLPLLNDLRAARGRPLLSESTLLLLNLGDAGSPVSPRPRQPSGEDIATLCKSLRPRFQLALLGWIRGDGGPQALAQLRTVAERLESAARQDVVHQLWWVVGGVLEALADGGLEPSVAVKRLIGQADREMKRLQSSGEARFVTQPPAELVNNLLYYVARATSTGSRVAGIREAFNLSGLIPGDEQVEMARQSLGAPSVKLMQTVAGAIREDLARVKDVLDIYVRTGMERVEELVPQVEMLKKIGDTLGVLGLGELREAVARRRATLEDLVAGRTAARESDLVAMAAALLDVEDQLESRLLALISPGEMPVLPTPSPDGGDQDPALLTQAVMRECLANLARVKEAISLVTERGGDGVALDGVPLLLRGITAALLMLERERAATLAENIAGAIQAVVQQDAPAEHRPRLERLADAIVSLEYYMETLQAGRREPAWMLDNAERCLDALELQLPSGDSLSLSATVAIDHTAPATVVIDQAPQPPVPAQLPSPDRPVIAEGGEGIEPEILELFIEEAREAIETVQEKFPAWELDEGDRDALLVIRRAFHTLKGSGRMVGAQLIGEYSWSVERLLNRVIDGTVARTPELMDFMRRAIRGIVDLLEQLEAGTPPGSDVAALMAEAEELTHREPAPAAPAEEGPEATELMPALDLEKALRAAAREAREGGLGEEGDQAAADATMRELAAGHPPEPEPDHEPEPEPEPELEESGARAMDPVLLDILSREVSTHLAVIRDILGRRSEALGNPVPEPLFRACHTLHGSLTMAGVSPGVAVAGPLNDLVGVLFEARLQPSGAVLDACWEAADAVAAIMDHLGDPAVPLPDTVGLESRLMALLDDAAVHSGATDGQDGGTLSVEIPVLADLDGLPEASPDLVSGEESRTSGEPPPPPAAVPGTVAPEATLTPVDPEVAAIYAEEAAELLESADQALARLQDQPRGEEETRQAMAELQRLLHTLKGGARMAGLFGMGDLSHEAETLLARITDGLLPRSDAVQSLLRAVFDELHLMRDRIPGGSALVPSPDLMARLGAALEGDAVPVPEAAPAPSPEVGEGEELPETLPEALPETLAETGAEIPQEPVPQPEPEQQPEPEPEPEPEVVDWAAGEPAAELPPFAEPVGEPMAESVAGEPAAEAPFAEVPATEEPLIEEHLVAETFADETLAEETSAGEPLTAASAEEDFPQEAAPAEPPVAGEALAEPVPAGDEPLPPPPLPALERLGALARELESPPMAEPGAGIPAAPPVPAWRPAAAAEVRRPARTSEAREFARVESALLEQLLNGAGEISIANSRLTQQLSQVQFHLEELGQTVVRLRDQLRNLEMETEAQILHRHQADAARDSDFDPLEMDRYSSIQQLSRALAETASDVSSLKDLLNNLTGDTEALLVQQGRTMAELQDGLMRTRMVPFHQHGTRLTRLVRQTARDTGKVAELGIEGSGELDRQVLEKLLPPFEHMLRNAVIHGIEPPAEREAAGKPAAGHIAIVIRRDGAEVVIEVTDDGRGLDVAAIRRKAEELGFVARGAPLTDEQAMQFILRSGFSTADQLTQAAGRGIGMDVVASQVARLGGTLSIASRKGQGTTFTLRLPFTLAVTQALIVRAGTELYALPLPTVEGIIRTPQGEFARRMAEEDPAIEYGGQRYRFRHLGQFLGLGSSRGPEEQDRVSIILVRAGENSTALVTDEMLDSREIVVKPVGPQLATIRGIAGATILGDGRIAIILDAAALVRSARLVTQPAEPVAEPAAAEPVALVVDDSITMRRVTQRLLERNGFRVLTAKDGVEAISVLQDHHPDIILLDVEMPRMDGYEFARHVRNNPATAELPIIMVTSRVSDKHRARAIEIGVNDYLGKPYQERELMEAVQQQLAKS